jgi:hypothetical protein
VRIRTKRVSCGSQAVRLGQARGRRKTYSTSVQVQYEYSVPTCADSQMDVRTCTVHVSLRHCVLLHRCIAAPLAHFGE